MKKNESFNHLNVWVKKRFDGKEMILFCLVLVIVLFCGCASVNKPVYSVKPSEGKYLEMEREVFDYDSQPEPLKGDVTYEVRKGDTLSKISREYGVSVESIKAVNRINADKIVVGDLLIIPDVQKRKNEEVFEKIFDFSEEMVPYSVKKGDTLGKIAKQHNITIRRIVEVNNIKNPNKIKIGQKLLVPKR